MTDPDPTPDDDPVPDPHSRPAPMWLLAVDVILSALLTGAVVCLIVAFFRRHNQS